MEALLTIAGTTAILVLFAALSAAFGSDSREGFAEPALRPSFR